MKKIITISAALACILAFNINSPIFSMQKSYYDQEQEQKNKIPLNTSDPLDKKIIIKQEVNKIIENVEIKLIFEEIAKIISSLATEDLWRTKLKINEKFLQNLEIENKYKREKLKKIINTHDKSGRTQLFYAFANTDFKYAQALLKYGAQGNINTPDENAITPLQIAIEYEKLNIIKKLLINGAKIGYREFYAAIEKTNVMDLLKSERPSNFEEQNYFCIFPKELYTKDSCNKYKQYLDYDLRKEKCEKKEIELEVDKIIKNLECKLGQRRNTKEKHYPHFTKDGELIYYTELEEYAENLFIDFYPEIQ